MKEGGFRFRAFNVLLRILPRNWRFTCSSVFENS
jgi:hypothetical protein